MNATVKQILNSAKRSIENVTGAEVSIYYKAKYNPENIERLKEAICAAYEIRMSNLVKKCRDQKLVRPRQMFYYLAIEKFGMGVIDAGKIFGHDHTTAIHSRNKVKDLLSIKDEATINKLDLINEYLK